MTDVIGSAEFEIRATTRQLQSDLAQAERQTKAELKKVEASAKDAQRELKRAFSDVGQSEFERSMRVIRNASDHTEDEVRAAANRVARDLKDRYSGLGAGIGQAFMGASLAAQVAFAGVTAFALKLASDAVEIESAFVVAFGAAEEGARSFSDTLADAVGRDAVVLREQMTRLQLVLTGTGVAAQTSAEMVKALTTAGVDAGSLFKTSDAEALQKIISGLTGETEPLKAFGVVISQAAMEAELLRLGFKGNASEASEAAKSIARANLIIKGLSVAQGDAARTGESAENVTKRMTSEFNKAARALGTELLPAFVKVAGMATNVLKAFNDLPGGAQVAGLAFLGLIAVGGPIAGLLVNLGLLIKMARETRLALALVTPAGAAAGAGAGAGLAAGGLAGIAARVLPVATTALAGGAGLASFAPAPDFGNRVAMRLGESEASWRARGGRTTTEIAADTARAQQNAQLEGRAAAAVVAAGPKIDTAVAGGFGLPSSLQTGTGGGGSRGAGRGSSGPSAEDVAAMREALDLQNQLDVARASGNEAAIKAIEERQTIVRLTADHERAGYEDAVALALAQVAALNDATLKTEQMAEETEKSLAFWEALGDAQDRLNELSEIQLRDQIELARLSGDEVMLRHLLKEEEIRGRIVDLMRLTPGMTAGAARTAATGAADAADGAERTGRMRDEFRNAFTGGIRAAIDGDLGGFFDSMADRFTDRMLDNLADDLFDLLDKWMKGTSEGSGGGWLSAIGSFLGSTFGGGRISGGPVMAGMRYRVGEHGPETLVMPRDGFVIPNGAMVGAGGGAQQQTFRVLVDVNDDRFTASMQAVAGPMVVQGAAAAYGAARADNVTAGRRQRQRFV